MIKEKMLEEIAAADRGDIQMIVQAAIVRYKELYPGWKILFASADRDATDNHSKELLDMIDRLEKNMVKIPLSFSTKNK